jgi:RNA polymerase sigma-70 factor (ECF subfamily)
MNLQEKNDKELVKMLQAKKTEAFNELVSRYQVKAYNLAHRLTRNQEDAEEVLQDVFTTLYTKSESFKFESAFSSWLYRIVVNCSFMKLRKRKQTPATYIEDLAMQVRRRVVEGETNTLTSCDSIFTNRQLCSSLESAISKLPKQYRAVFILRDVDGLSNEETSEILNLTVPAVKSRLHRSRLMLRRKLQGVYSEYILGVKDNTQVLKAA